MRGGFIVATDPALFERAASALVQLGAAQAVDDVGDAVVQLTDESGRLFTLYERVFDGTDWEVREGPFTVAAGVRRPDMRSVAACPFDCRWPDLVTEIANVIARAAEGSTWVLDGDGVIWDAEAVDPSKVQL